MLADTQESPNTLHTTTPDRTHVSAAVLGEMRNRVTELAVTEPDSPGLSVVTDTDDRVQARLAALDRPPEPDPLPEAVRNRIMALREDCRPGPSMTAGDGGGETKVFDADEDVKDSEGLKKALGDGSGSSA